MGFHRPTRLSFSTIIMTAHTHTHTAFPTPSYAAFVSMLLLHERQCNPVMITATRLLASLDTSVLYVA